MASRLAQLSLTGLQHAQALESPSVAATAARLYAWNRMPASVWRKVEAEPALLAARAIGAAGTKWIQILSGPPVAPWCIWRPRSDPIEPARLHWKVYVSPHPLQLAEAVAATMAACDGLPAISLKYGADAQGMLRPDKLVVHLTAPEAVHLLADRVLNALDGCPVHGVPYTAELGGDGLISWGCDPPAGSSAAEIGPSWRTWVTRLLAEGLAAKGRPGTEPWERSLNDIERAGVDPRTWAPKPWLWANADAAA
ncbi:MAG: hypothetical protein WCF81_09245 [Roseiarcus sp.]